MIKENKVTKEQLIKFIKEEAETSKLYKKLGFITQGEDEKKHSQFFKKQLKDGKYK